LDERPARSEQVVGQGAQSVPPASAYIAEDEETVMSELLMQSVDMDEESEDMVLSIDDGHIVDDMSDAELVDWARLGTAAAARVPATRRATTIESSFFILLTSKVTSTPAP